MPFRILSYDTDTNAVWINPREIVSFQNVHDSKILRVWLTDGRTVDLQDVDDANFASDVEGALCCDCEEGDGGADDTPTADIVPEGKP